MAKTKKSWVERQSINERNERNKVQHAMEAALAADLGRIISESDDELTRSLSHYLGAGATARYPTGELYLSTVPEWQSRHHADSEEVVTITLQLTDSEECVLVCAEQPVRHEVARILNTPGAPAVLISVFSPLLTYTFCGQQSGLLLGMEVRIFQRKRPCLTWGQRRERHSACILQAKMTLNRPSQQRIGDSGTANGIKWEKIC